jgi:hypothetical protein
MRFEWAVTVLGALWLGGVYLDGWAHTHGRVDETFFTPWHAVLYAGYLVLACVLVGRWAWGVRRGAPWRRAMPDGYGASLAGVGCWIVGGPFDAVWHEVFGFEADVEALLSPAHTLLALGFGLMVSGPLRAALRRPRGRWIDELPMVLSLTCVVSILTFFTQIAHPLANLFGARGRSGGSDLTELGVVGLLLTSTILAAPLLFLLALGRLPAGAVVILIGINSVATGFVFDRGAYPVGAVVAFIAGALAAEIVRGLLRPAVKRAGAFLAWAFLLPVLLTAAYFLALLVTSGIAWSPHLWLGSIVFCGIAGWLVASLVRTRSVPPSALDGDERVAAETSQRIG